MNMIEEELDENKEIVDDEDREIDEEDEHFEWRLRYDKKEYSK